MQPNEPIEHPVNPFPHPSQAWDIWDKQYWAAKRLADAMRHAEENARKKKG